MMLASTLMDNLHFALGQVACAQPPCVWEMFCNPESELINQTIKMGLCGIRINLSNGYDFYKQETYPRLDHLWRKQKPKRMWVSTPCTYYCDWSDLNYYDRPEVRRNERCISR